MTDTNELTGRELAVACGRAMYRDAASYRAACSLGKSTTVDDLLAWLHERGKLHTSSEADWTYTRLLFRPSLTERVCAGGATFTEALQRLVVAVAQRGSGGRA